MSQLPMTAEEQIRREQQEREYLALKVASQLPTEDLIRLFLAAAEETE